MRRLFPDPEPDVDPADAYRRLPPVAANRPALRLNMLESVDAAAAVNGRTAGLGGTADHTVAAILRSLADIHPAAPRRHVRHVRDPQPV